MLLRDALGILSKSSPHAVTTSGDPVDPIVKRIKDYLFVETDIERAFRAKLESIASNEIVFLCGSSGDGKSEILTRYRNQYESTIEFHLDATHSFEPK
ncbi:DNA phosphorothioation-dependent restriction protein DptF, partial [Oleiphilus sp. HI0123]|uniref:DNA phosphorothioation-dependent restriction protein DptF n=1 Tax=Oleiphilus sp. HI0123 TaxID=1822265 RepID=UPI0008391CAB